MHVRTKITDLCALWLPVLLFIAGCGQRREITTTFLCRIEADRLISGALVASPDRRHVMYVAADNGKQRAIVDGTPEQMYDGILEGTACFSRDGGRHAYGAGRAKLRFVVLDGVEQPPYDGIREGTPVFSPDGRRVSYGGLKGDVWAMVIDGREGWVFDELWPPVFSADGAHCAYVARTGPKQHAVLDTVLQRPCDKIDHRSLAFDHAGRLTYLAFDQGKAIAVNGTAVVAPDSINRQPRAYVNMTQQPGGPPKWSVVCDSIAGPAFDQVGNPVLSPDGIRFGYIARQDSQWFVVIDGRRGATHPLLYPNSLAFGSDGDHYAFASQAGNREYVVLDDRPGQGFDAIIAAKDRPIVFDSPAAFHYLALSHDSVFVVDERIR